ncbi:2,3-bisphosphoglycerate-independent phosphoglycerate mutase [Acidithiobacillus sp. CV18-2]|uniref:2,3-bisphosphoglycerate-independent phosphoglycerate mutase n=1 Tax=Igneacidithiobacillus copahuensis TaxID=2724909 RepID=A0AAE2YPR7_9PROT|nr:2,3-bisphosphoglycerate-independent phosphoglycerate mutase [Acidithiobacillus sp. CV18-3]MBU2756647.1 2,3-bisphosphoglycerate-independent phosphoglycerate mutase [Acidithiobacillus sp. BN09-2]MBU2777634.1 2,3-bisphosphoglycerate-independent phosphoglycerate mutase [Acidithiobacillus sp. CV18-2]MBU2787990.1 2,3-bisphosphoglycerate-independent phosphoglycerate mutase [Igneacidithiobacillus copahuensis]MBU2796585.1 2,3-bisphosphoglycerate-independent phosphoglycerate mutase [Acidithiobacillus 
MSTSSVRPVVLLILDGWGYREAAADNAIALAHTPHWDSWWKTHPHALLQASEASVGLPRGQMGNSEVGHINIGAGRVVYQEYERINRAIADGSFYQNAALVQAVDAAQQHGKAVHILGLLSPGGVHSHEDHLIAGLRLARERGAERVYLHAFLDGRDTAPRSAAASLRKVEDALAREGGCLATLIGRYYAMDRDHRWDRVQKAYDLITQGLGTEYPSAEAALEAAYTQVESDEFVPAARIGPAARIEDGDSIVFLNFRSDRARQITRAFVEPDFSGFPRAVVPKLSAFVTLTEYSEQLPVQVAFPPSRLRNTFGEWISRFGMRQLRIAETEKYAHVTFFFNGGEEQVFEGEDRVLIPSPSVATYDLQPEMSVRDLADRLIAEVQAGQHDVIICNIANPDMVGHSGKLEAAKAAVEAVDQALGRIVPAVRARGGEVLITADHGNVEQMLDPETGQAHTAHTCNPVPLLYIGRSARLQESGALEDLAPTLLQLLGLPKAPEMSGKSLIEHT